MQTYFTLVQQKHQYVLSAVGTDAWRNRMVTTRLWCAPKGLDDVVSRCAHSQTDATF